jgi:hypothetical protein
VRAVRVSFLVIYILFVLVLYEPRFLTKIIIIISSCQYSTFSFYIHQIIMTEPNSSSPSVVATEPSEREEQDVEAQKTTQKKASHWRLVLDQTLVTPEVLNYPYRGSGTENDPYVVEYIPNDQRNPMLFSVWKKWMITVLVAFVSLPILGPGSLSQAPLRPQRTFINLKSFY